MSWSWVGEWTEESSICVGSVEPWAQAIAIAYGASSVVTVDYNRLTYQHPQMATFQPQDFDSTRQFGAIISISSLDHDGLGRYGDPLCPDGDLLSMATLRSQLAPRGVLFLSVPIGPDVVVWNLHRRYGPVRLPLLLHGYRKLNCFGWDESQLTSPRSFRKSYEPVFVLQSSDRQDL